MALQLPRIRAVLQALHIQALHIRALHIRGLHMQGLHIQAQALRCIRQSHNSRYNIRGL
jgi:hypothetical protein